LAKNAHFPDLTGYACHAPLFSASALQSAIAFLFVLAGLHGSTAIKCNVGDRATYNGVETVNVKENLFSCPSEANACVAYSYKFTVSGNVAKAAIGECTNTVKSCDMVREELNDLIIELYPWIRPQYRQLHTGCIMCSEDECNSIIYFTNSARKDSISRALVFVLIYAITTLFIT
jgi:hypothetical protein